MAIADNLRRIQERIAKTAITSGRAPNEITLVGVTKYVAAEQAAELAAAGCYDLGESRPQELWTKTGELASANGIPIRWHLIGHLQRNKIRRTLPLAHLIHSIDSDRLLAAINAEAESQPTPIRVLLEVNTSGESAKQGLAPTQLESVLAAADQFPRVAICGLMTMAALEGGPTAAARNFALLRELRDRLQPQVADGVQLAELSMGMSNDFEIAIREGATIVRIGSALWE